MNSRQRVIEVINHGKPDRVPIFGWLGNEEFAPKVIEAFGSIEAFTDKYEFDVTSCGPNLAPFRWDLLHDLKMSKPEQKITPDEILDVPLTDPEDMENYRDFIKHVKHIKENKEQFIYTQTWGYFEGYTTIFGIEEHLVNIMLYKNEMKEIHKRLAAWHIKFANNVLDAGVDMVHFSDDWGAQRGLLFSPDLWRELVYPYYAEVIPHIKKRKAYVSLHSDGNISQVLDGVAELGFDVVHPYQESAGMDFDVFKRKYMKHFTVMGGLDVQNTIGFGKYDFLKNEIERILAMFKDGGMIFSTSHAVQPHCTVEELVFAYDFIYDTIRKL